jgi:predicted DsbA family dithiol-disulfide isomerase
MAGAEGWRFFRPSLSGISGAVLVLAGAGLAGCAGDDGGGWGPAGEVPEVVATLNGEPIERDALVARAGDALAELERDYARARHRILSAALEAEIRERVIFGAADARGMELDALVDEEAGAALEISSGEVVGWYLANQSAVGGRSLDDVRGDIVEHLRTERRREAFSRLEARLRAEGDLRVFLEPPRFAFRNEGAPAKGPRDAPVTLVEFTDFQCPFCRSFVPTLDRLAETFGDDLRIVVRHFPIESIHPYAFRAAEASMCADEMGSFWPFHDLVFEEQDRVTEADLMDKAERVGLGVDAFRRCLESGRHAERVRSDMEEAARAGVTGTPALFVNGVPVEGGAVPFEVVEEAIRRELARRGR